MTASIGNTELISTIKGTTMALLLKNQISLLYQKQKKKPQNPFYCFFKRQFATLKSDGNNGGTMQKNYTVIVLVSFLTLFEAQGAEYKPTKSAQTTDPKIELLKAVGTGNLNQFLQVLDQAASPEERTKLLTYKTQSGNNLIHLLLQQAKNNSNQDTEIFLITLLEQGVSPLEKNNNRFSPLHYALLNFPNNHLYVHTMLKSLSKKNMNSLCKSAVLSLQTFLQEHNYCKSSHMHFPLKTGTLAATDPVAIQIKIVSNRDAKALLKLETKTILKILMNLLSFHQFDNAQWVINTIADTPETASKLLKTIASEWIMYQLLTNKNYDAVFWLINTANLEPAFLDALIFARPVDRNGNAFPLITLLLNQKNFDAITWLVEKSNLSETQLNTLFKQKVLLKDGRELSNNQYFTVIQRPDISRWMMLNQTVKKFFPLELLILKKQQPQ